MQSKKYLIIMRGLFSFLLSLSLLTGCNSELKPSGELGKPASHSLYPYPPNLNSNQLIGFVNDAWQIILPPQFDFESPVIDENLLGQPEAELKIYGYSVAKEPITGEWQPKALLGLDGQLKTEFKYRDISWANDNLAKVTYYRDDVFLAGLLDLTSGEEITKEIYQDIYPLTTEMCWVRQDNHSFVIDRQEKVLFILPDECFINFYQPPDQYFPQGLLSVNLYQPEHKNLCFNNQGQPILENMSMRKLNHFYNGVALMQETGSEDWRLINYQGDFVGDIIVQGDIIVVQNFALDAQWLAVIITQNGYGVINGKGQWVINPSGEYSNLWVSWFDEPTVFAVFAQFSQPELNYKVFDMEGNKLMEGSGYIATAAPDRFIVVNPDIPQGQLLNTQGEAIIPVGKYKDIHILSNGLLEGFLYDNNYERFDLLNTEGALLKDNCRNANSGMSADDKYIYIQQGGYHGYIDKQGNWLFKGTLDIE